MAGDWDVVSEAPAAAPQGGADPWSVVSEAPAPGILENARSAIQGADMAALRYLNPGPDDNALMSGLKTAGMVGVHGLSLMAQAPVNALIGAGQGATLASGFDPDTGAFHPTISPEQQTAATFAASPLRGGAMERAPVGTFDRPVVRGVEPADPALAASAAGRQADLGAPATSTPTGFTVDTTKPPTTAAGAKEVAGAYYDVADKAGGTLAPSVTNQFIDNAISKMPKPGIGQAARGASPVSDLVDRVQGYRDQPMSLHDAQALDESLGDLIDGEFKNGKLSKDGVRFADIQRNFRNQIEKAGPDDVTGGTAGFDALAPARKAWSQAMKLGDLERIQQRADLTLNPATSVQTQLRALLTNPARIRGYSPDEVAALRNAAEKGVIGGALHVFGSRLIPIGAGLSHGFVGAAAAHVGTSALRNMASRLAEGRLGAAGDVLGASVPPMPGAAPRALPEPPSNSLLRYVPPLLLNTTQQRDDAAVRP